MEHVVKAIQLGDGRYRGMIPERARTLLNPKACEEACTETCDEGCSSGQ